MIRFIAHETCIAMIRDGPGPMQDELAPWAAEPVTGRTAHASSMGTRPLSSSALSSSRRPMILLAVLVLLTAVASSTAPAAQASLGWTTLDEVYVDPQTDRVVYPETVRTLRGQTVRVTGYLLPLDTHTSPKRFLLSALSLAECYYCQPTGPGTTIEVRAARPVRMQTTQPVRIEGRLVLLSYRGRYDDGLVYRLDRAQLIP